MLLLFSFYLGFFTFGALEPSLNSATPFFKAVGSPFPSGQAKKSDLLSTLQSSVTDFQFRVLYNDKNYSIKHDSILREMELATQALTKNQVSLSLFPEMGSSRITWLKKNEPVEIISRRGAWVRVKTEKKQIGYLLTSDLEANPKDVGHFTNLITTPVFQHPRDKSSVLFQLAPLTQLKLIKIVGHFGYFKTQSHSGYIPLSQVIGRSDFAEWGWNQTIKKWQNISYRNGSQLVVKGEVNRIPLGEFTAFRGQKNSAIVTKAQNSVGLGARVQIEEAMAYKWNESYLKGHGLVWWKTDLTDKKIDKNKISTKELLQKKLTAMSFDSKRKKGLASAGGIYQTLDGKNWSKLDFFGQQDWPVLIHPTGVWFVGSYKSSDEGESFQPYLKWSEIVKKMQGQHPHRRMPFLKVVDLISMNSLSVKIKIDTGSQLAMLQGDAITNDWKIVP